MAKVEDILTKVEEMTVLELAELIKKMEEKFGVSAAAPMMVGGGGAAGVETAEVKDEFDVVLVSAGDKKIQVLKVLREVTGLGLKEVKDIADKVPANVKESVKKADAEEMKKKLLGKGIL